jgi:hypothetical protein
MHLDDVLPRSGRYRLGARILPALIESAIDIFLRSAEAMPPSCALNVHHAQGAAIRVPVSETAQAYRDEHRGRPGAQLDRRGTMTGWALTEARVRTTALGRARP